MAFLLEMTKVFDKDGRLVERRMTFDDSGYWRNRNDWHSFGTTEVSWRRDANGREVKVGERKID